MPMATLLQIPPEICAKICEDVERADLISLLTISRLFSAQARRFIYRMVDLRRCSHRALMSSCLAVTRHTQLAERVHSLLLDLPADLALSSDGPKIARALSKCVNLKELTIKNENDAIFGGVSEYSARPSIQGWMITKGPFRLTKFANSYFRDSFLSQFWSAQSEIRILSIPTCETFPCYDDQLPNLIAVDVGTALALPKARGLQRIQLRIRRSGYLEQLSALSRYSATLTTLNLRQAGISGLLGISTLDILDKIAQEVPGLLHLGLTELFDAQSLFSEDSPISALVKFAKLESFIFCSHSIIKFHEVAPNHIDVYDLNIASGVQAFGSAIMNACPTLRLAIVGARVYDSDPSRSQPKYSELVSTLTRTLGGGIESENATRFDFPAVSMFDIDSWLEASNLLSVREKRLAVNASHMRMYVFNVKITWWYMVQRAVVDSLPQRQGHATVASHLTTMLSLLSPFSPRLGTNYCPEDGEVAEIKALIAEPVLQLQRLDDEIAEMQKAIDKLTKDRDNLGAYIGAHKALISPVRRLPLDIIQEIFLACLPTRGNCIMSASEAPVILGRICSSWRTISLSTPHLWARLHIVEPACPPSYTSTSFEEKLVQRLKTTKTWLDHSGQCPLSISLESCNIATTSDTPPLAPSSSTHTHPGRFLQALIPFASRWQHIEFRVPPVFLETLSHLTAMDVPMLKSVAVHQQPQSGARNLAQQLAGILHGSNISSFSSSGTNFIPSELPLRWNRLTALSIMGPSRNLPMGLSISTETALETISACPELRKCELRLYDGPGPTAETRLSHPIIEHRFLQTLEVLFVGTVDSTCRLFFGHLMLPELRSFSLKGSMQFVDTHVEPHVHPLILFLASSRCLQNLELTNMFLTSSLSEIVRSLPPTIQRLYIYAQQQGWFGAPARSSFNDGILADLTPTAGFPVLCCPALQDLYIEHCPAISDAALLRFITARMAVEPRPTLARIDINFDREIELDVLPSLQPFIETGLVVSISHLPPISSQFSPWQAYRVYTPWDW
ncbi:hypothetical protein C8R44DRAFT_726662 [Mycena epipterygia]|nr:hypothetical protein C8R44DRAFT_726662 [Mycena epipterygia]